MMEYNAVHTSPSDCQKDQIKCVNCVQSLYIIIMIIENN